MWFYELKNDIFNRLIVWMMKHCYCSATVFYTACERYYPKEVTAMYESWKISQRIKTKKRSN